MNFNISSRTDTGDAPFGTFTLLKSHTHSGAALCAARERTKYPDCGRDWINPRDSNNRYAPSTVAVVTDTFSCVDRLRTEGTRSPTRNVPPSTSRVMCFATDSYSGTSASIVVTGNLSFTTFRYFLEPAASPQHTVLHNPEEHSFTTHATVLVTIPISCIYDHNS